MSSDSNSTLTPSDLLELSGNPEADALLDAQNAERLKHLLPDHEVDALLNALHSKGIGVLEAWFLLDLPGRMNMVLGWSAKLTNDEPPSEICNAKIFRILYDLGEDLGRVLAKWLSPEPGIGPEITARVMLKVKERSMHFFGAMAGDSPCRYDVEIVS